MYKSLTLPLAKEDIWDAARWYNKKSQGLGKRFTAEVRDSVRYTSKTLQPAAYGMTRSEQPS